MIQGSFLVDVGLFFTCDACWGGGGESAQCAWIRRRVSERSLVWGYARAEEGPGEQLVAIVGVFAGGGVEELLFVDKGGWDWANHELGVE